ncbi:MAG: DUF1015 domain-containing protein [Clostridiales bacterium]|nr:DUF1015 domain-containing protein [Clostridiales bacterium]
MDPRELLVRTGEWLLPKDGVNLATWACVACDQYTSQREYWEKAAELVGDKPSTLKLILPECYLEGAEERIPKIHQEMKKYLEDGVLEGKACGGLILTVRTTPSGNRVGLVVLIDLEGYDYRPGSASLIRATEGTILERIPPRLAVRRGAALEMSHVLMLLDDPERSVVEPLYEKCRQLPCLYDFPLMMGGGRVAGYAVANPQDIQGVYTALGQLKAGLQGDKPLLYAVGDGNHSLAAAKAYWEELKPGLSAEKQECHPARFALVELENIHEEALVFKPIHRLVTGYAPEALLEDWRSYAESRGMSLEGGKGSQEILCVYGEMEKLVRVDHSPQMLAVGTLQAFLDNWLPDHPGVKLDYIHGDDTLRALARQEGAMGFLLPKPHKDSLFATVRKEGVLPRKTFSMGEANEKRYYLETRRLV